MVEALQRLWLLLPLYVFFLLSLRDALVTQLVLEKKCMNSDHCKSGQSKFCQLLVGFLAQDWNHNATS